MKILTFRAVAPFFTCDMCHGTPDMTFDRRWLTLSQNKAKVISAKLLELNFKNKLDETGGKNKIKRKETGRISKNGRK